jgi:transposase
VSWAALCHAEKINGGIVLVVLPPVGLFPPSAGRAVRMNPLLFRALGRQIEEISGRRGRARKMHQVDPCCASRGIVLAARRRASVHLTRMKPGVRTFCREFKFEAVKLVKERGVSVTQAAADLGISPSVMGRWGTRGQRGSEAGISGSWADEARRRGGGSTEARVGKDEGRAGYSKKTIGFFVKDPT